MSDPTKEVTPEELDTDPRFFTINITGNLTRKTYAGKFWAKPILNHNERGLRDRLRRERLGNVRPEDADPDARGSAVALSELAVRLAKWPPWWTECDMGGGLHDTNVVKEVYEKALKVEEDYIATLIKVTEGAKKTLADEAADMDAQSSAAAQ